MKSCSLFLNFLTTKNVSDSRNSMLFLLQNFFTSFLPFFLSIRFSLANTHSFIKYGVPSPMSEFMSQISMSNICDALSMSQGGFILANFLFEFVFYIIRSKNLLTGLMRCLPILLPLTKKILNIFFTLFICQAPLNILSGP